MSSVIECEEELACLTREEAEELDKLESTLAWFLSRNYLKSTINSFLAVGDAALLKTIQSDSVTVKDKLPMSVASTQRKLNHSESLLKARHQVAINAKELDGLYVQMRSGHLEDELDKCRAQIREYRSKRHSIQYELNAKQQMINTEELEISGLIDVLKEIIRDTETTIECHEQELQKMESILNDENSSFISPLFADLCKYIAP